MTAATLTAPAYVAGAAPAGLNEAQLAVWQRLEAARAAIAALPPLDADWLRMERRAEQHARLDGDDR